MSARVMLATENDILSKGLETLLPQQLGIRSVVLAGDGARALQLVSQMGLDVAIVDVQLADPGAFEVIERCRKLRRPVRCIALDGRPTRAQIDRLMAAGVAGIVSTRNSTRSLGEAVRRVHAGCGHISPDVTRTLLADPLGQNVTPGREATRLTVRERDVLRLIAEGRSSREIAIRFRISTRTVETHRGQLMKKLRLNRTAALVRFAIREGLVGV